MTDQKRMLEEESNDSAYSASDEEPDLRPGPIASTGYEAERHQQLTRHVEFSKLPWGIWLLERVGLCGFKVKFLYKALILVLTFCCYTTYHLTRKPISVVKVVLHGGDDDDDNVTCEGWTPFNGDHGKTLLGVLDYTWLFAYAICMYFSGQIADRTNLRYFLTLGMLGSAISVGLLGVAYFENIHYIWYFIIIQLFGGLAQSTGWPGNVAVMSHWFGKHNRGLIMGIWNSHTSIGNILGTIIPSFWADCDDHYDPWGWSFIVPSFIMIGVGLAIFLFLVNDPRDVGVSPPVHHLDSESEEEERQTVVETVNDGHRITNGVPGNIVSLYSTTVNTTVSPQTDIKAKPKAVNILKALLIPGVLEYSFSLFFNKLVSYTFLFWLPLYIKHTNPNLSGAQSAWLSTLFDVGGMIGGIVAGLVSDLIRARAVTCVVMLLLAIPSLFFLRTFGSDELAVYILLLIVCGIFINGPYGMITTAVSSDLGTHKSLKGNQNAKATVTAIIDGTGSIGAALGPLIFGLVVDESSYDIAFYVLMVCCFTSAVFLLRLIYTEFRKLVIYITRCFRGRHNYDSL